MDVELLDNIIEEATDDLLMQEIRPESEWMALLTFHFVTNRIDMICSDDSTSVIEAMHHICMMSFGPSRFTIWNPMYENPLIGLKAKPSMMLFEMKIEDGKPIHLNAMRAQIPLSFESIREVSCFLNLIARAFATSLYRIDIDNGSYQCILDANKIKEIHQLHYFPNRVEFRELYQTLVFPWFPTEERRISALEKYYDETFEDFILRRTTLLRINQNKDVKLPFINKVLNKRVTLPESEERALEITHGWWSVNHDKMNDDVKSYLFSDEKDDTQSRIRHIIAYDCGYISVLILLRGPIFISNKIWVTTASILMNKDELTLEQFKKRLKTYNLTLVE